MNELSSTRAALGWLLVLAAASAGAAPASDALDRPALSTRQPERALLLSAAVAGQRIVAVGERGIVVSSADGGRTWQQSPTPVSVTLTAIRFANERDGLAVGHGGIVLATADGGRTWVRRLDGRRMAQLALDFARASGDALAIKIAERTVSEGPDKPLLDALLIDGQRAVVVGAYGLAFATDDGGEHWDSWTQRLDNPKGLHLYAIRRRGDELLIAGEQGLLLRSDDAGRTFSRLESPYKGSYFTAELPREGDMVVAGLRGNVWQSSDGGRNWRAIASPMPSSITSSTMTPDGKLLMTNQAGLILQMREDRLVPLNSDPLPPLSGLVSTPDGSILALTVQGVLPLPAPNARLGAIATGTKK